MSAGILIPAVSCRNQFPPGAGVLVSLPFHMAGEQIERIDLLGVRSLQCGRIGEGLVRFGSGRGSWFVTRLHCRCNRNPPQSTAAEGVGRNCRRIDTASRDARHQRLSLVQGQHFYGSIKLPGGGLLCKIYELGLRNVLCEAGETQFARPEAEDSKLMHA